MKALRFCLWAVALLMASLNGGCAPSGTTPPASAPTTATSSTGSRPVSLISPISFFPPEQERLARHLNWNVGSFRTEFSPQVQDQLVCRTEVWTQGRPEPRNGGRLISRTEDGEISISLRDAPGNAQEYQLSVFLNSKGSGAALRSNLTRPKLGGWSSRVIQLTGPTELPLNEDVPVWAFVTFKEGNEMPPSDARIFDQLKAADWSVVVWATRTAQAAP